MEKEKAIEIFNKWMGCKDAYQADPSCNGNCFSCEYYASAEEEKEAMQMAISALEFKERYDQFWEEVKTAGSRRKETEIHHSGRVFRISIQNQRGGTMNNGEAISLFHDMQGCRHQALHTNDCGDCERCQFYHTQEQLDEAVDLAISALEKQEADKCCETCKHKDRLASEWRCSECFRASNLEDYWEPYTEEEA